MAHAPGVTVVIAGADALETSARALSFLTLFWRSYQWKRPFISSFQRPRADAHRGRTRRNRMVPRTGRVVRVPVALP